MSAKPAVLESTLAPFVAAGLRVSVQGSYLLLHDVPVVDDQRQLRLGTLIATLVYTDSQVTPPATHQVWFDGPFPCFASGAPLEQLRHSEVAGGLVAPEVPAKYFFSNKNEGWTGYATHFDQLMHYWRIITDQARVIDPQCTQPLAAGSVQVEARKDPFRYPDASSRPNSALPSSAWAELDLMYLTRWRRHPLTKFTCSMATCSKYTMRFAHLQQHVKLISGR
ncbi:hypothetical protein B0G75_12063 [Paraburkholderia sp. BL18I3N2]|uniref:DUF6791 domain-containing protein n=1 Tax=Paraburkholderia sp. BL18I3N2 TaxID=1938799 RepID=UPI000D4A2A8B|nr:DUF6791 domain-containing protein [Paraburkholderia sp. BL18I3N2]PRX26106.1 hypothetical protein B0G75_12063 [Paraburkholderia sp. BL18I3N2]